MVIGGALERTREGARPIFMIKGGVALELRLPGTARATKDLDIVVNPPGVDLTQELDAALVEPFGGFSFRRKAAVHDLGGGMLRVEVVLEYLGSAWGTMQVDLALGESRITEVDFVPAISLEPFGLTGPDQLPCLSLRHHIAQKIHGMTRPSTADWTNDRERDLVDLLLLEEAAVELRAVRGACLEVFGIRGTHPWPPRGPSPDAWKKPVMALVQELAIPIGSYEEATSHVWKFIERIDQAR